MVIKSLINYNIPYFVSSFPYFLLKTELPNEHKIPKFSKFVREIGESTIEFVDEY